MNNLKVGYAGLTHLGLNSLAATVSKGYAVVGYDESNKLIEKMATLDLDINEPGLVEILSDNHENICFSNKLGSLSSCDIVYISSDVDTDDHGNSDLSSIESLIQKVAKSIKKQTVLVILCQVHPGFTRKFLKVHQNTFYQVETLIFGQAILRAQKPERFIIGCKNPAEIDKNLKTYLSSFGCPILPMTFESAELSKTAINLFLAANVSTANTLAEICEKIGADWSEIIPSLRLDRRIGQYAYIETGLGLSGGNIERDLRTISSLAHATNSNPSVVESFIHHSKHRKAWLLSQFNLLSEGKIDLKIGVLGLAYKKDTHSTKNSPTLDFLSSINCSKINVYDPVVNTLGQDFKVNYCPNAYAASEEVDILFIITPWKEFYDLDLGKLISGMKGRIVVDPYGIVPSIKPFVDKYVRLGSS